MRLPPYPTYKPSGVEWLGDVPEHWGAEPLKYSSEFINGMAFKPEAWSTVGVPIIRIENLNGGLDFNCFESDVPVRYHVGQGDLLFGWSGNRGTSFGPFLWCRDGLHYLNQHIFKLTAFTCDKSWFYWCLKAVTRTIEDEAHGIIGMVHVTRGKLGAVPIPLVTPVEQRAIADFLDRETSKIDTLVAKKRTLIERLKEKRTALISRTVTRGLPPEAARAAGLDSQPKLKPSGIDWLGDVPEHWEVERLSRACDRVTDGAHISPDISSCDYPFVSTVDITDGRIDVTGCLWASTECFEYLARSGCKPRRGDVLFSKDGTVGRTAVVDCEIDFVVASSLVIISPRSGRLDSAFLNYWLNGSLLQQDILLQLAGAALRRISVEKVARLPVVLPKLDEQHAIAAFLDRETGRVDEMLAKVETAIERLREYRTALITAAVTGKIDVRNALA